MTDDSTDYTTTRRRSLPLRLALPALCLLVAPAWAAPPSSDSADMPMLRQTIDGAHRSAADKQRDAYRHPLQTLTFFGLRDDAQVLELSPGGGWYTAILAPVLRDKGLLTVASFGDDHPSDFLAGVHKKLIENLSARPDIYDRVKVVTFDSTLSAVADNSMDLVLTFRNTHNWIRSGAAEGIFRAAARVLKPGGVLGLVQHRAMPGNEYTGGAKGYTGYVSEAQVIELATRAGLQSAGQSEINANPRDIKDYPEGVWTLPPSLRLEDKDKDRYIAIGESDRMTLRFVKP